jgi:hypothetical protein
VLRDVDGTPITAQEERATIKERYSVPEAVRKAGRSVHRSVRQQPTDVMMGGRGSSTKKGVPRSLLRVDPLFALHRRS